MTHPRFWLPVLAILTLMGPLPTGHPRAESIPPVILATTTSTVDSGLLDELLPVFEQQTGIQVKPISVGSGQAMALGRRGEADILLAHSPADEEAFMREGHGATRKRLMYNDFILVGPESDPAAVRGTDSVAQALSRIATTSALFVSRGDNSGTHARELSLWRGAGLDPAGGRWYLETGSGMGQTLAVSSEKAGYTLVDRGTWLALRSRLQLVVLVEGEPELRNTYHVITVNPARHPRVNAVGADRLAGFFFSPPAITIITRFGQARFGQPLFVPDLEPAE